MKRMGLIALMALLCLPMGALAVREGVIEDAPMVEARRKTSYLPMHRVVVEETGWMLEEAYTEIDTREMSYDDIRANLTSNCRLTTGERKRMEKLMAAYAAGEQTGDGASVLEAKKNVRVGVYALDPAEYDGERVLLLLPGNCLTDEEMLAILDAYRELGEVFDPDALNERNCVRGHTFMGTSEGDNEERRARLKGLIQRGIIRREDVPETLKAVDLNDDSFLGSYGGKFILTPYRRLTDDELLDMLFLSGFKNESEAINLPAAERNARLALREKNGCPLSMELTYMNTSYDYGEANGHWGRIPFVTLMFEYVDEAGAHWNADAFINGVTSQTTGTHVYSYDAE